MDLRLLLRLLFVAWLGGVCVTNAFTSWGVDTALHTGLWCAGAWVLACILICTVHHLLATGQVVDE